MSTIISIPLPDTLGLDLLLPTRMTPEALFWLAQWLQSAPPLVDWLPEPERPQVEAEGLQGSPVADEVVEGEEDVPVASPTSSNEQPGQAEPLLPPAAKPAQASHHCAACDRTFASENGLKIHRGRQHRTPTSIDPPVIRKGRERFLCSRCTKEFETRGQRDTHQATHPVIPPDNSGVAMFERSSGGGWA